MTKSRGSTNPSFQPPSGETPPQGFKMPHGLSPARFVFQGWDHLGSASPTWQTCSSACPGMCPHRRPSDARPSKAEGRLAKPLQDKQEKNEGPTQGIEKGGGDFTPGVCKKLEVFASEVKAQKSRNSGIKMPIFLKENGQNGVFEGFGRGDTR